MDDFFPRLHNPSTRVQKSTGADRCRVDTRTKNERLFGNDDSGVQNRVSNPKIVWELFYGTSSRKHEILHSARVAEKSFAQNLAPFLKTFGSRSAQVFRRACFNQSLPARCIPQLQLPNP